MAGISAARAQRGGCAECWNDISMSLIARSACLRFDYFGATP